MHLNPVHWFEIYVADMPRARVFYETVLGIKLTQLSPPNSDIEMCGFPSDVNASGSSGALVKLEGKAPGAGGTLVYFSCRDCADEAARVEAAGGQLECGKMPIGRYGFIALARDTEGNSIGFHSLG